MKLEKWLKPNYDPTEGSSNKRKKNKKVPRHLPRRYRAFNTPQTQPCHGSAIPICSEGQEAEPERPPWIETPLGKGGRAREDAEFGTRIERTKGPWSDDVQNRKQKHNGAGPA